MLAALAIASLADAGFPKTLWMEGAWHCKLFDRQRFRKALAGALL